MKNNKLSNYKNNKQKGFIGIIKGVFYTIIGGIIVFFIVLLTGKKLPVAKQEVAQKLHTNNISTSISDEKENIKEKQVENTLSKQNNDSQTFYTATVESENLDSEINNSSKEVALTSETTTLQTVKNNSIDVGVSYNEGVKTGAVAYEYIQKKQQNNIDKELLSLYGGVAVSKKDSNFNVSVSGNVEKKKVKDNGSIFSYNIGGYASVDNKLNTSVALEAGASLTNIKVNDTTTFGFGGSAKYENINGENHYRIGVGGQFVFGDTDDDCVVLTSSSNKTSNLINFSEKVNNSIVVETSDNKKEDDSKKDDDKKEEDEKEEIGTDNPEPKDPDKYDDLEF